MGHRGVGLHQVLELVSNRETRRPMSEFNQPLAEPMQKVAATLRKHGISTFVRFNWIFCAPPLIISTEEISEALKAVDAALAEADVFYEG